MTPEEARALVEKATPGPWRIHRERNEEYGEDDDVYIITTKGKSDFFIAEMDSVDEAAMPDATFITTFDPELVTKLIDLWEVVRTGSAAVWPWQSALDALEQTT